jgi:ketosteroid isomerase-like protein
MASAADTAERFYGLLGAEDAEGVLALCSESIEVRYPGEGMLAYGGRWVGRDGVERFLDAHDAAEEILVFEPMQMVADGDTVVVIGTFTGRARPDGREWSTRFAHCLTIRHGLVQRWEAFFDTRAAAEAHVTVVG